MLREEKREEGRWENQGLPAGVSHRGARGGFQRHFGQCGLRHAQGEELRFHFGRPGAGASLQRGLDDVLCAGAGKH